ncbi:MAG: 3-isopropylmalate dehydratase small subunit [Candidatus Caldatribacterium sp.]|nr:3-isopropylmalate dehydratase small subunit [Candidatus Caldatribacterium sp.]
MIRGRAVVFRDNVDTDVIIPARYLTSTDPKELAKHCMEGLDPNFPNRITPGETILVAGKNFGCGSSREHAPLAIKGCGVVAVIAASFARIFFRNAINIGLPILESEEAASRIREGDTVAVDLATGEIRNETTGEVFKAQPFPPFLQEIIASGGLMNLVEKRVKANS